MPKNANPHPHVDWRAGRPRFKPGPQVRALGYEGKDLRHDDGRWFSRGEAVDWSEAFQAELAQKRGQPKKPKRARQAKKIYSLGRLLEDWQNPNLNIRFDPAIAPPAGLAHKTRQDYREKAAVFQDHDPSLWASDVTALTRAICRGLFEDLWRRRGLSMARGMMAVLSAAISWGILRGKVKLPANPCHKLQMQSPAPRVRFATRAEIVALVAAADAGGRPEIGDCIYLAVWTGQRQGDRLALTDKGLVGERRVFRQKKTGAIVAIRKAPELEARLAAARARRKVHEIGDAQVILDEKRWTPFTQDHYSRQFAQVRKAALERCPSLETFQERDLRDTAVTWMALAGATVPEICAVTGHTLQSATRILRHYLAAHPEMADAAIGKMISWYDAGGETEIGL